MSWVFWFSLSQSLKSLWPNIKAWLTVSLISIPLSISLAVASGATPLQGILTAIWACIVAGFFGSSNYNIFWPAGALTALLMAYYGATQDIATFPILAIVVALRTFIIWALRLTKYVTLIPATALHWFIAWVSLTIAFGQLNTILWLVDMVKHESVIQNLIETFSHIGSSNVLSVIVFAVWFLLLQIWKRLIPSIPAPIPIALLGILFWWAIQSGLIYIDIQLLADKFPNLVFQLGDFTWFDIFKTKFNLESLSFRKVTIMSWFVVAVISILETMISAKIAGQMTHTKFNERKETFWTAMANLFSWLFGWLPTTAVLIRTALNVKSWATSYISAIAAGWFVLLISWLWFTYFTYIPMAVIAAILVNIALWLLDFKHYREIYNFDRYDAIILAIVAFVTFLSDPVYGVLTWVSLSLLRYLKHSTEQCPYVTVFRNGKFMQKTKLKKYLPDQKDNDVLVIKFTGEISFLSVSTIQESIEQITIKPIIVFAFSNVARVDLDGIETLEHLLHGLDNQHIEYHFSWLSRYLKTQFEKTHCYPILLQKNRVHYATADIIDILLQH